MVEARQGYIRVFHQLCLGWDHGVVKHQDQSLAGFLSEKSGHHLLTANHSHSSAAVCCKAIKLCDFFPFYSALKIPCSANYCFQKRQGKDQKGQVENLSVHTSVHLREKAKQHPGSQVWGTEALQKPDPKQNLPNLCNTISPAF